MIRKKTSRPTLSVPKKCMLLGGAKRLTRSVSFARLSGKMIDPPMIKISSRTAPIPPNTAIRCLRKRRQINWLGVRAALLSPLTNSTAETGDSTTSGLIAIRFLLAQADTGVDDCVQQVNNNGKKHHSAGCQQEDA